ncbi:MAG: DUF2203 domain-containing protein [Planctomycetota bacterium]
MTSRVFTADEANRTIPLVRTIVGDIVRDYELVATMADEYKALRRLPNRDESHEERLNHLKTEMKTLSDHIDGFVKELGEIGCEMKDLSRGLVDFPAELEERRVYLCWMLGEESIEHWHEVTEGFAGRKPLPVTVPED